MRRRSRPQAGERINVIGFGLPEVRVRVGYENRCSHSGHSALGALRPCNACPHLARVCSRRSDARSLPAGSRDMDDRCAVVECGRVAHLPPEAQKLPGAVPLGHLSRRDRIPVGPFAGAWACVDESCRCHARHVKERLPRPSLPRHSRFRAGLNSLCTAFVPPFGLP